MIRCLIWRSVALSVFVALLSSCGGSSSGGVAGTDAAATPTTFAVSSVTPGSNATAVALDASVVAVFSRNPDPASITSASFAVLQVGVGLVPGGFLIAGATVTFQPTDPLLPNAQYLISIGTGVRDTTGTALSAAVASGFATLTSPGAPVIGSATTTLAGQATVTFTAPASNGGAPITGYTVTANPIPSGPPGTGIASSVGAVPPPGGITVPGLATTGTPYTFTVTATNIAGVGPPSAPSNSITPDGAAVSPSAPLAPLATVAGDGQATVSFSAPAVGSPITSYTVTASPGGITASGAATSIVVPGLTNGTAYTFTVVAFNSAGPGPALGPSAPVTPIGLPGAPTAATASSGNSQATVTFAAPASNGGSTITGYTVTSNPIPAGPPGSGIATSVGAVPPPGGITVPGLANGTPYTFTVTATNAAGVGPPSLPTNSVTPALAVTAPGAPTGAAAVAGNAQATVSFTPPTFTGGAPITSYTATSSPSGVSVSGSTSPIVVPGLSNGTAYTFTVTATNSAGTGAASAPSNSVVPVTVPGAPTGPVATAGIGQATVSFTPPASNGGAAIIAYTVTSNTGITASGGASPITVVGLTNGIAYSFTVTATNSAGTSAPSVATGAVTPTPGSAPSAPTNPIAVPGNAQVNVSFTPPADAGASAITSYTVTSNPGGISATGGASPILVTGLTNGTTYVFSVAATNSVGTGPASGFSNAVTPATLPGAPISPAATAGDSQATVTFTPPSNGGCAINSYTVIFNPGNITTFGTASPIVVTGLSNGTAYTFTIAATNCVTTGPAASGVGTVTPNPAVTVPPAPTAVSATAGNAQATVSFTPPTCVQPGPPNCPAISGFTVTARIGGVPTGTPVNGLGSPIVVGGLTNGTAYTFTVTANNSVGASPPSGASTPVTPITTPGAPTSPVATAGDGQATVSFVPPASSGGATIIDYTVTASSGQFATATASPIAVTVPNNVAVTFTVTARNSAGTGPASVPSNSVTPNPAVTVPPAPTAVSATAGNAQATVSFTPPTCVQPGPPNCPAISGFTVTARIGGVPTGTPVNGLGSPIVVGGLTNGTAYTFTVTATNAVGTGPASGPSSAVTPADVPGAPTGVTAIPGNSQATVSFTPPANNGSAISSYLVTASTGQLQPGTNSPITVTGLTNGVPVTFTVNATNGVGTGLDSAPSAAVTPTSATPPSPPLAPIVATAGNAQATVTFAAPASNGGSAITGYTVTSTPGGLTGSSVGAVPPPGGITVTGLTNGTPYTFSVTATNAIGISAASVSSNIVTPAGAPGAPTGVNAVAGNQTATISFTPPASNGGSAITSYTVTSSPGSFVATGASSPITYPGTPLTNGTPYTFTVTASNAVPSTSAPSAPSNSVIPTASATACSTPGGVASLPSGTITLRAQVNRASGVAPLAVFFDATATTSATTAKPFHELEYRWDFGDPGSGTWNFGSRGPGVISRNQATGPVASHVFDPTPGFGAPLNRTVTLTATNGTDTATCSIDIVVDDPDVFFAGAATLCASDNGDFTGCPAATPPANRITNSNFLNIVNGVALNGTNFKRILLRAGGNYTNPSAFAAIRATGPGYIGVYPAGGAKAIITGITGNPTQKLVFGSSTNLGFEDWRVIDLDINGVDRTGTGFGAAGPASKITLLRNRFRNIDVGSSFVFSGLDAINVASTLAPVWNQWAIVDNVFDNLNAGHLIPVNSSAFQGNQMTNVVGSVGHSLRIVFAQKLVISNNEIFAPSGGAAITVRNVKANPADRFVAPSATGGNQFTIPANSNTEQVVIADNRLVAVNSVAPLSVRAITNTDDARFRNVIVERNYCVAGTSSANFLTIESSLITVRNNIFDYNALPSSDVRGVQIQQNGGPPMDGIAVFNNSLFTPYNLDSFNAVRIVIISVMPIPPTDVVVRNNLGYSPGNTNNQTDPVRNIPGGPVTQSNNSTGLQMRTVNPLFATHPPTAPAHWQPIGASYAINGGFPGGVPVLRDFFDNLRSGNHIGAVNP